MHGYKEHVYTLLDGVVSVSQLKSGKISLLCYRCSTSTEAEVASQDKQCRKSSKYNHYDADVHTEIVKCAYEKTLRLTQNGALYTKCELFGPIKIKYLDIQSPNQGKCCMPDSWKCDAL